MKIGVLGYTGFVGNAIYKLLQEIKGYVILGINSHTTYFSDEKEFDVVINCAGFSRKYEANQNPNKMWCIEYSILERIISLKYKSLVHISSIEAELKLDTYGIIKNQMENHILSKCQQVTILRLGGLIGEGLKKNIIFDLINDRPLFVTANSLYNYISTNEVANIILYLINNPNKDIINIGASESILVSDIVQLLKKNVIYGSKKEIYLIDISKLNSFYKVKTSEKYIREFCNI